MAKRKFGVLNDRRFRCRSLFPFVFKLSQTFNMKSRSNGIRTNSQQCSMRYSMPERLYMPWNNSDLSRFTTTRNSSRHPTVYNCIVRRKSLTRTQRLVFLFCFIRHLQDNLIKRIRRDGTFRRLRSLRTLYVFSNEISSSSECLFVDRDLRNNQLEEIDDDAFDGADSLNEL